MSLQFFFVDFCFILCFARQGCLSRGSVGDFLSRDSKQIHVRQRARDGTRPLFEEIGFTTQSGENGWRQRWGSCKKMTLGLGGKGNKTHFVPWPQGDETQMLYHIKKWLPVRRGSASALHTVPKNPWPPLSYRDQNNLHDDWTCLP